MTDPISDMLTRIRNAGLAGHGEVLVPLSKFKLRVAHLLEKNNLVRKVSEEEVEGRRHIRIALKYIRDERDHKSPFIQGLRRVSREGQRIYAGKGDIPKVRGKFGFSIVSTSKGLMTGEEARKAGVGGEIICEIW